MLGRVNNDRQLRVFVSLHTGSVSPDSGLGPTAIIPD